MGDDLVPTGKGALASLTQRSKRYTEDAQRAKRTKVDYSKEWVAFEAWCTSKGLSSEPPNLDIVLSYLTDLADPTGGGKKSRKVKGIEHAYASIAFTFRLKGHEWYRPELISRFFIGLRRSRAEEGERVDKKAAITAEMLKGMCTKCLEDSNEIMGARDRALLTTGWIGAFRRSEIVGLNVDDIEVKNGKTYINLRKSKTNQTGEDDAKYIPVAKDDTVSALKAMQLWLKSAGIENGAIFRRISSTGTVLASRLNGRSVALIVKRRAKEAGFNANRLAGHSLRAGFMTEAESQGKNTNSIMKQSGHKSERIARGYFRHEDISVNNAAEGLL